MYWSINKCKQVLENTELPLFSTAPCLEFTLHIRLSSYLHVLGNVAQNNWYVQSTLWSKSESSTSYQKTLDEEVVHSRHPPFLCVNDLNNFATTRSYSIPAMEWSAMLLLFMQKNLSCAHSCTSVWLDVFSINFVLYIGEVLFGSLTHY
jgi:hypothetical protein